MPKQVNTPSQYQRLAYAAAKADQQVDQSQNELQSLQQKMGITPAGKRPALESLIAETQSELAFRQARRDALRNILQFTAGTGKTGMGGVDLRAQIEELARSVPPGLSGEGETPLEKEMTEQTSPTIPPSRNGQQASGIWGSLPTCSGCLARGARWISRSNPPSISGKRQGNCVAP